MVTIIVVNWNGGDHLRQCLECLSLQTLRPEQIVVVDNASTDNSVNSIPPMDNLTVHPLDYNMGFAGANNLAISLCATRYVVLLNPDAFPEPEWLQRLVEAADAYPDVAAFGSRQMKHGEPDIKDGVGDTYHLSGLVWREGFGRRLAESDRQIKEIFSPCAAAALYRLEALEQAGGFDEDYFCYSEDVDLGFRLRLLGYRSVYVPDAIVYHVGSASSGGQKSDFSVYYGHRNLVWTFVKNMPGLLFWLLLLPHLLLNAYSLVHFALRGQGRVILRAKLDAIGHLPAMFRKRSQIQATRKACLLDIWRVLGKRLPAFR